MPPSLDHRLPTTTDVVVVGARAAGAATALLLARAGLSVLLLDRDRPGADTLSTHALMRGGVLQLARWGLVADLREAGTPPIRQTTFHYPGREVAVDIKPSASVDALYAPRRTVLDQLLARAASGAGATVRHRVSVVDLLQRSGRVVAVQVRTQAGATGTIRANLVIGADGRHSGVAAIVGAPVTHTARHTSAFTYGYWAGLDALGYEWGYCPGSPDTPAGTSGFIPTNGGLTCVFGGGTPEQIGRGGLAVLEAQVERTSASMAERLRKARLVSPIRTFTGQPGWLRRPWGPGWALVGDAGSWHDPITAHGLTSALRDAELLARAVLDDAREPWASGAPNCYEQARDRLSLPILQLGDEIAAMAWSQERIEQLLRALSEAMGDELRELEALPAPRHQPTHRPSPALEARV